MSQIEYSGFVSNNVGKLNGTIFQRVRDGNIMRNAQRPNNRNTASQQGNRTDFSFLIKNFSNLSPSVIVSWNSFASGYTWLNKLSQPYHPTGQLLYVQVNTNLFLAGLPLISSPVSPLVFSPMPSFVIDQHLFGLPKLIITFTGFTLPAHAFYIVYATTSLSPGISYARKYLKQIAVIPAGTVNIFDATASYISRFAQIVPGKKIFFKLRCIDETSGFAGVPLYADCIAVTPLGPHIIPFTCFGFSF